MQLLPWSRSPGNSFVLRFFSAVLTQQVFAGYDAPLPYRYSAMAMCAIFLIGLIVLPFAPETKGKPLPED